jgi:ATP-dependent DNA ligase
MGEHGRPSAMCFKQDAGLSIAGRAGHGSRSHSGKRLPTPIVYAFDLIEHDREDLRDHPFLERKVALGRLLLKL